MSYDVAIIGTGAVPGDVNRTGFAMAYVHADAYEAIDDCELVACADIVRRNAEAFAAEYDLPEEHVYEDYRAMLDEVEPDIVSVAVPPGANVEIVLGCVKSGVVDAIHCEKPMATTWGGARLMAQEADRRDVQLTFNHQRRFAPPWRRADELLAAGEIGDLERVETFAPTLYDWGTHCLDLCGMFAGDRPAEWVLGQLDYREENVWFGAHNTNQTFATWTYENGIDGLVSTGEVGRAVIGCFHRLVGTDGRIEVRVHDGPALRIRRAEDATWETIDVPEREAIPIAIADVVSALREGTESALSARNALNATELIFGTWESSRRRGRVDLPLEITDNPLEEMIEAGELAPAPAEER